jgi:hypothetical protein
MVEAIKVEPLSGFSDQTAMQLVRSGRVDDVLDYVDAVDAGVHAFTPERLPYRGKLHRALDPVYARAAVRPGRWALWRTIQSKEPARALCIAVGDDGATAKSAKSAISSPRR